MRPARLAFVSPSVSTPRADAEVRSLETRVSAEFREMPGLVLTITQAARLFGIDVARCGGVLDTLVAHGVLSTDGRTFARADAGARCA
jgi:hypothetical protein